MISRLYLYAAGALLIAGALGGLYLKGRSDGAEHERAKYSASVAAAQKEAREKERIDAADSARREAEQLQRVRNLETRIAGLMRTQPIRLCQPAGGSVSGAGATAAGTDAGATGDRSSVRDGQGAVSDGPDIRDAMVQLAHRCESDRQQLIALQDWVAHR